MLTSTLCEDLNGLQAWLKAWDRLAVETRLPYCSPSWMLAWWRNAAPSGARLRVILVADQKELIAVAPFYVLMIRGIAHYRLLGSGTSMRLGILARLGTEAEAAHVITSALADAKPCPDVIRLEGVTSSCPWPSLLQRHWPASQPPWMHQDRTLPAPVLSLREGSFNEWLESKSANFRKQMRRDRRLLEQYGAAFKLVTKQQELQAGIADFSALHRARWSARGGSSVLTPKVEKMLAEVGTHHIADGRFRLWLLQSGHQTIAARIMVAAGGEVSAWNSGFDQAWADQHPSLLTLLAAIEHAWEVGDDRMDLGGGGRAYKYRFADAEDLLQWLTIVPRGPRYPLTRLSLVPCHIHRSISTRLPVPIKERLRSLNKLPIAANRRPHNAPNNRHGIIKWRR